MLTNIKCRKRRYLYNQTDEYKVEPPVAAALGTQVIGIKTWKKNFVLGRKLKVFNMPCVRHALLILALALVCGINGQVMIESRILNGELQSNNDDFKFLVAIVRGIPICGGTLISPNHVLTAGHCVYGTRPYYLSVLAGVANLADRRAITAKVRGYYLHPQYQQPVPNVAYLKNDIGVLKLTAPLDLTLSNLALAILPKRDLEPGTIGVSAGWGDLNNQRKRSSDLYKAYMRVWPLSDCQAKYSWHTQEQFCGAGHAVRANMCSGDSGGPLMVNDTVVGIISVSTCSLYGIVTYTKVYSYLPFIEEALKH